MFPETLLVAAREIITETSVRKLKLATAESCTAGLISACLCQVPGSSAVVERGFVTYSNEAKVEMLHVPVPLLQAHGAVSAEVAQAMAAGALANSRADLAVAVTGIAGPGGGTAQKPVGLVHLAAARKGGVTLHEEQRFGDIGRLDVQLATVAAAFALLRRLLN